MSNDKAIKIAIIGSPGSGKSTLAAGLFYFLKISGKKVELIPELIKTKVYKGADFSKDGFDISNSLEQMDFENIFIKAKHRIDYLIMEAPLCNGYFYSSFYKKDLEIPVLQKIAKENINKYDIIVFVKRTESAKYIKFGRKESLEEAQKLEKHIKRKIKELEYKKEIITVDQTTDIHELLSKLPKGDD